MAIKTTASVHEVAACTLCNTLLFKCEKCMDFFFEDDEIYCINTFGKTYNHFHVECLPNDELREIRKKAKENGKKKK